jgi:hypothetical protein
MQEDCSLTCKRNVLSFSESLRVFRALKQHKLFATMKAEASKGMRLFLK